jgi:hypothetical protein
VHLPVAWLATTLVSFCSAMAQEPAKLPPGVKLPPGMTMHRLQAGKPDKDGWYVARSTEGHFRVKFPIPFNDYSVRVREKDGREVVAFGIGSKSIEGIKFSVLETLSVREPRKSPKERLEQMPEDMRKNGNTISRIRRFEQQGHPAIRFHAQGPRSLADRKCVGLEDRAFLMIVEYPADFEKDAAGLLGLFFDSLEILDLKPAVPAAKKKT